MWKIVLLLLLRKKGSYFNLINVGRTVYKVDIQPFESADVLLERAKEALQMQDLRN